MNVLLIVTIMAALVLCLFAVFLDPTSLGWWGALFFVVGAACWTAKAGLL